MAPHRRHLSTLVARLQPACGPAQPGALEGARFLLAPTLQCCPHTRHDAWQDNRDRGDRSKQGRGSVAGSPRSSTGCGGWSARGMAQGTGAEETQVEAHREGQARARAAAAGARAPGAGEEARASSSPGERPDGGTAVESRLTFGMELRRLGEQRPGRHLRVLGCHVQVPHTAAAGSR